MRYAAYAVITICAALVTGCVTKDTYQKSQADTEAARKTSAQTAAAFEAFKKQSAGDIASLQQELTNVKRTLDDANTQGSAIEQQRAQTAAALSEARAQARDLETKLSTEQAKAATLEEEKQRLLSGTTIAQEEIARLQKAAADRDALFAKLAALTGELAALKEDATRTKQERDQLLEAQGKLQASLDQQQERLKTEEADKARLEEERAAKEAEVQRLTKTHEDLTKSLQAEIAKGDVKIKQVADRLTINMVEKVLFDSGQAQVKPGGLKVLKQVSDILKSITDKQIRIEGHTDNVPIGVKLRDRFPTNWELSTARATSVVRYLIEQGGLDASNLTAVGYADTRPVVGNDTEEGRTANRRIEIVLYPKDL